LKYRMFGYARSTQLRGVFQISPGKVVKPTGTKAGVGPVTAVRAFSWASSQYERAADAPVAVNQYKVMLSTRCWRVRLPAGWLSTNAWAIFW
jgi:hypothetical protein